MKSLLKYLSNVSNIYHISLLFSLIGIFVIIIDFGFNQLLFVQKLINVFFFFVITSNIINTVVRYFIERKTIRFKVVLFDLITLLVIIIAILKYFSFSTHYFNFFTFNEWIRFAIFLSFIKEVTLIKINLININVNPAQLFIVSFFATIFFGALLLMLPNATINGISFVDALFTSTSAVCVTGLIVVDTATYFTHLGQTIILILIQIGGLGILTFVTYFSYFFKGGTSYKNQLVLSDISNVNRIGEVFSLLKKVLFITITIELFGAILIYFFLNNFPFVSIYDRIYFSFFHSISAFCNAGFSTLTNGLFDDGLRFNYLFQSAIIIIFVLGGLGFPIVANLIKYIQTFLKVQYYKLTNNEYHYKPWVLNINSRITLITTLLLTIIGSVLFYFIEYNNVLIEHHGIGKVVTAIFGATTPRTAGFNSVNMMELSTATVLITIFLMWIGAAPLSTGGGIKTSTFAVAILNFISLARGKSRIEIFRRELSENTIRRAFATIFLSLLVVGMGIVTIAIFDNDKSLTSIAFECFSAYSTVGLSVGITSGLTIYSKWTLIIIMFIGRVSMLSILIAFIKKEKYKNYRYPNEEITIN